ncbi:hypothetical protein JB92DRAFT_3097799, partial [Gautieria morchelliformis]
MRWENRASSARCRERLFKHRYSGKEEGPSIIPFQQRHSVALRLAIPYMHTLFETRSTQRPLLTRTHMASLVALTLCFRHLCVMAAVSISFILFLV